MILEMEKESREGGEKDIYQKTDVEHILDGLGESLQVQDELEVVHGLSPALLELTDQTPHGLLDHLLRSVQLAGVVPVLVDVEGAGLLQGGLGLPRPGRLLLLRLSRLAGDGSVEEVRAGLLPNLMERITPNLTKVRDLISVPGWTSNFRRILAVYSSTL